MNKTSIVSMILSAALAIAPLPAMSADTGPLSAAPAAGVKQAQGGDDPSTMWVVGAGVVIGVGILLLANNNNSDGVPLVPITPSTPSTTTTTTTKAATTTTTTTTTTP